MSYATRRLDSTQLDSTRLLSRVVIYIVRYTLFYGLLLQSLLYEVFAFEFVLLLL